MYIKSEKDRQNAALFDTDKLRNSKVLLIGLGGLGSPVAYALAGAGIGKLTLCDKDTVSESNLNRQTLYTAKDIGKSKAKTACNVLSSFAPDCDIDFDKDGLRLKIEGDEISAGELAYDFLHAESEIERKARIPALFVNFDKSEFYSQFPGDEEYLRYLPDGWRGATADFSHLIPPDDRYWVE